LVKCPECQGRIKISVEKMTLEVSGHKPIPIVGSVATCTKCGMETVLVKLTYETGKLKMMVEEEEIWEGANG